MYMAIEHSGVYQRFFIRESYLTKNGYRHRDLMPLGPDPRRFIRYVSSRAFIIDPIVEETISQHSTTADVDDIESLFWPYLRPDIQRKYEFARSRDKKNLVQNIDDTSAHLFDKRRLLFLKTGSMSQKGIETLPESYFHLLHRKSRDELENQFMDMETHLPQKEIKSYLYVVFDLQRHFRSSFARHKPQALDPDKIADYFVDDLCTLNQDKHLWTQTNQSKYLNAYLQKYLILFFDTAFSPTSFMEDLAFAQFHQRRFFRQTKRPLESVYAEAAAIFKQSPDTLKKMTRKELKKQFRQQAQALHPDKGGNHNDFLALAKVYEELMERK